MSIALVLGSGGHTSELIRIVSALPPRFQTAPHIVLFGRDDALSRSNWWRTIKAAPPPAFHAIPRARRVGQSFLTAPFTTLHSLMCTILVLLRTSPRIVLCNGPAVSVCVAMAVYIVHMLQLGRLPRAKIVYVESVARVQRLSLSGRLMLSLADHHLIQWRQLAEQYRQWPNVVYSGLVV